MAGGRPASTLSWLAPPSKRTKLSHPHLPLLLIASIESSTHSPPKWHKPQQYGFCFFALHQAAHCEFSGTYVLGYTIPLHSVFPHNRARSSPGREVCSLSASKRHWGAVGPKVRIFLKLFLYTVWPLIHTSLQL